MEWVGLAAEVAASYCLRRAAALAGLGLELRGQTGEESLVYAVSAISA